MRAPAATAVALTMASELGIDFTTGFFVGSLAFVVGPGDPTGDCLDARFSWDCFCDCKELLPLVEASTAAAGVSRDLLVAFVPADLFVEFAPAKLLTAVVPAVQN